MLMDTQTDKKQTNKFANLISKLNFYKLIPYPMDNCFTGRHDRSGERIRQVAHRTSCLHNVTS